jgi:MSHA biogenesis protein MshK
MIRLLFAWRGRIVSHYWIIPLFLSGLMCLLPELSHADLRDPTRPPKIHLGVVNALVLKEIVISPNRSIAVINDRIVRIGDNIEDAKIIAIKANSVELDGPDGMIILELLNSSIKHRVNVRDSS